MRFALPLSLPLALVLAGCPAKAQQVGGVPRREKMPRVVSLSPGTTEIVGGSMDARLLVGRTEKDDFPTSVSTVPVVASVKPDFEKIKGVAPSVLLYDADLYNADDVKRIEGMGAEPIAFKAHTIAGFERELYALAGKLGSETNVASYVARIESEANLARADRASVSPKVAVVLPGGDYVAGTASFLADVVKTCGGTPVGPASDKFAAFSPEAAVAAAPDLIVLATSKETAEKDVAALKTNPRFANSPAVKNGRITPIQQDVVLRRGNRVDALIKAIHHAIALMGAK